MFSQYFSEIFEMLVADEFVSRTEIASKIMVSPRKVQNIIQQMDEFLSKFGVNILSKPGKGNGYYLSNRNIYIIKNVRKSLNSISSGEIDKEYRQRYIIWSLFTNEYINIQQVADELFVSDRVIRLDVDEIKEIFKAYNLSINKYSNKGICVDGNEKDIRRFLTGKLFIYAKQGMISITEQDLVNLKEQIVINCEKYEYPIIDYSIENMAIHFLIMVERVLTGHNSSNYKAVERNDEVAKSISNNIIRYLEAKYTVILSEFEEDYIYLQVLLKKENKLSLDTKVDERICNLVLSMLRMIDGTYNTKLEDDFDLCMNLNIHFIMLLKRLEYDMQLDNPMINEIKSNYHYSYELASFGADYLNKELSCTLHEGEIGFIALYLQLSLSEKNDKKKNKILIVCASGKGISEIVKRNFKLHFKDYIGSLDVISMNGLIKKTIKDYDYIFSTVPIDKKLEKPIFYISGFLQDEDVKNVGNVLENTSVTVYFDRNLFIDDLKAKDRYEVIQKIIEHISQYISLPTDFKENVIAREDLYSTSLGNNVAFPHPKNLIEAKTFICIARLSKPIKWDQQHAVKLVIMVSIDKNDSRDMSDLYDSIAKIINYPENVNKLVKQFSYENLMNIVCHR